MTILLLLALLLLPQSLPFPGPGGGTGGGSTNIAITNPSFEDPVLGGCGSYLDQPGTGWIRAGDYIYMVRLCDTFPVPDGVNTLELSIGPNSVTQSLTTNYAASKTYTLKFYLCHRNLGTGEGASAQLLYGTTVLADTGLMTPPAVNTCVQHTLTYTSPSSGPMLGQPIVVKLLNQNSGVTRPGFDLVTLTAL